MLYTPQAPVLDLTGAHIKTKEELKQLFMPSTYVHMKRRRLMVAKEKEPNSQSKYLSDSDSSDDNEINPRLKTLVEERQYNTIPGSTIATHIALSYSRVQMNPTVERGTPC